jgi:hypothetical protein
MSLSHVPVGVCENKFGDIDLLIWTFWVFVDVYRHI